MENEKQTQAWKRKSIILSVIIIVLILAAAVLVGMYLLPPEEESVESGGNSSRMAYEANIITDDSESLQDAVNRMLEKAAEGQMSLHMKTAASSEDGRTFTCYLANSAKNSYDMFMVLYLDDTQQEIHRTGLIPVGGRIEEFTLEEALEPGTYEATLVYNQVEDDRETIHAQVNVGLVLIVN